jgi:hypothetical protein
MGGLIYLLAYLRGRLPAGYHLDLISDPDTIILQRPNGTVVARFTRDADPEEVKLTAEEDATRQARA